MLRHRAAEIPLASLNLPLKLKPKRSAVQARALQILLVAVIFLLPVMAIAAGDGDFKIEHKVTNAAGVTFEITHYTIDGGYSELTGGNFSLRGIIGQPEPEILEAGNMVFSGGFLTADQGLLAQGIFADGFESPTAP